MSESALYGFGYKPEYYRGATERKYHLFSLDRSAVTPQPPPDYARANRDYPQNGKAELKVAPRWTHEIPLLARAMVLAGETLFVAGPPPRGLQSPLDFEGPKGGVLAADAAADGETRAQYRLDSLPAFDGMVAAGERLYLTTEDGRLLGKEDFPATWWVINVLPDGRAELVLGEGTGEGKSVRPTCKTPLPAGAWAPLAFTVDRKHRQVTCCLNGVADATTPLPPPLTGALGAPGKDLRIPSSYKPFTGLFDEFRIYTRVLSEAEVKARYGTEKRGREGTGKE